MPEQPFPGASKIVISAPSNAIAVTGAQRRTLAAGIHRYGPQPGSYGVLATSDIAGGMVRALVGATVNHALVVVDGDRAVQMTPDGVALTDVPDDPNIVWSQPVLDPAMVHAICVAAKSLVGGPRTERIGSAQVERWAWTLPGCVPGVAAYMVPAIAYRAAGVPIVTDPGCATPDDLLRRIWRSEASSLWAASA